MVIWYASLSVGLQKTERRERHYSQQSAQKNLSVRLSVWYRVLIISTEMVVVKACFYVKKTDDCLLYVM